MSVSCVLCLSACSFSVSPTLKTLLVEFRTFGETHMQIWGKGMCYLTQGNLCWEQLEVWEAHTHTCEAGDCVPSEKEGSVGGIYKV